MRPEAMIPEVLMSGSRAKRMFRRLFKISAVLVGAVVLGVGALLGFAWVERRTNIELPQPTGPYAVGRDFWTLTDNTHSDPLAPVPGRKRELLVWMWYPGTTRADSVVDDYYP